MRLEGVIFSWNLSHSTISLGPKHRQRFLCELRVEGYNYVGAGNSVTKKEAQKNASRDFVNYLVRSGEVSANDVPEDVQVKPEVDDPGAGNNMMMQQRPVFQVLYLCHRQLYHYLDPSIGLANYWAGSVITISSQHITWQGFGVVGVCASYTSASETADNWPTNRAFGLC